MAERIKASVPLAVVIGVLAFIWCEVGFNYTFHWSTAGDLGTGLSLPTSFHLVVPAAFVAWGFFFAAGADTGAFVKVLLAQVSGCAAALLTIITSSAIAPAPDFWGIGLMVAVFAIVLVLMTALGDWHYVPAAFGAFAVVFLWWTATGLDYWAEGGGGAANTVDSLSDPLTAGAGAFGGVLSTPYFFVVLSVFASLVIGCVLGLISVKVTALITPAEAEQEAEQVEGHPTPR